MEKKALARHLVAILLSGLSYNAAANTSFSKPAPTLSDINAYDIKNNVKSIVGINERINNIDNQISLMDSSFNNSINRLKKNNNNRLKSETTNIRNELANLRDTVDNSILDYYNVNAEKIQSNTDLINDQVTSINKDREKKHHAFDSKLKEVELYVQGALIGVNAADQVTEQLNTNIQDLDRKVVGNTSSIKTLKSDAAKTQKANELKFTKLENKFDHGVSQLDSKIDKRAQEANAGIASVAAMSNIPYATNTRFSAGVGVGNYKNGSAIAAGAQYQLKENINLRSSVSWNNSDAAVIGAGVAFGW
ncbi:MULTISPECIES: YadA C-terminal domain-containing protein [Providencia]|uniref:YadA-like family protein n=1 Tax=Providencia huaxiensis TaxID=2027290 RepID=A0ABU2IYV1_9GAMM|nr:MULTISPECIES: YadA C-terminal domain-containing protein [Providencia]MDT0134243.1 YadA-like family protein [Providencia huaxiensis]MDT1980648.1 YadA-like family protein [Providencia huaxiensis]